MENKYSRSKVYKLQDDINFCFYIGSTCDELRKRLYRHKADANREICAKRKLYSYFKSIGWENVKIILIQEFNLENRHQLLHEEDKVVQAYLQDQKCLNVKRPFYGLEPKEQRKVYRETNKEHIFQQNKEYVEQNKEKVFERRKKYRENNKQKIYETKQRCYQNNIEHYKLKNAEKVLCACGSELLKMCLNRHMKSNKHLMNIAQQQQKL